jgi:hypothetical protein
MYLISGEEKDTCIVVWVHNTSGCSGSHHQKRSPYSDVLYELAFDHDDTGQVKKERHCAKTMQ